jgi:hypothetical protein
VEIKTRQETHMVFSIGKLHFLSNKQRNSRLVSMSTRSGHFFPERLVDTFS